MRLLVDAGNTRLKWQLRKGNRVVAEGTGGVTDKNPLAGFPAGVIPDSVAVSSVASDEALAVLLQRLSQRFGRPPRCYWAEAERAGLANAYADPEKMGADRWHAMYGAWLTFRAGFVVVDAGSAVTIDYVDAGGQHLGGFILPGQGMMVRNLQQDVARVTFEPADVLRDAPGRNTSECVNHGLSWLLSGIIARVHEDARRHHLKDIIVTGGDAPRWLAAGLQATHCVDLVFDGLAAIDAEETAS